MVKAGDPGPPALPQPCQVEGQGHNSGAPHADCNEAALVVSKMNPCRVPPRVTGLIARLQETQWTPGTEVGEGRPQGTSTGSASAPGDLCGRRKLLIPTACPSLLSLRSIVLSLASWLLPAGGSCIFPPWQLLPLPIMLLPLPIMLLPLPIMLLSLPIMLLPLPIILLCLPIMAAPASSHHAPVSSHHAPSSFHHGLP